MGRVVWLTSEDMPEWDSFVESHPFGWISHLSAWKEVLEASFKHVKGHFLAMRDPGSSRILAGLPIYAVKSWLTGNRLVSVPFITHSEVLVTSSGQMQMLLPHIMEFKRRERCSRVELHCWRSSPLVQGTGLAVSRYYRHHYLRLDRDPDELRRAFHRSSIQRRISKAVNSGITLTSGTGERDVASFYDMFSQTRKRLGLPPIPYIFFQSLWRVFGHSSHLTILFAVHQGMHVASVVLLKFRDMVVSEFNCDSGQFRNLGGNQFCDWEAVRMAHKEGYDIFSLGRTSPQNKGLMEYKDKWATSVECFSSFFAPGSAFRQIGERETTMRYKLVKKLSEKSPAPLFHLLGRCIYRHMG